MNARAIIAITLSYLLGLGAFLAAADVAAADPFGVVCSQGSSTPNQQKPHAPHHACCVAGACTSALLAPPPQIATLAPRVASHADRHGTAPTRCLPSTRVTFFRARGPPSV